MGKEAEVVAFCLVCLVFGTYISYLDFGKPMPKEELYEKIRIGEMILSDRILGVTEDENNK